MRGRFYKQNSSLSTFQLSSLFTTENVVKCGYSMDAGCFENPKNEFREMGKKIFQPSFLTGMKFIITLFLPIISRVLQFRFLSPEICVWLKAVLQNNLAERKKTPLPQEDLLQWLLNGMESDRIDEEEAISHAFSFFIEGFETSSGVMTLTLYALAKNKDVQTRLRKEIRQVLDDHENEFTFNALQDMLYLEAVIQGGGGRFNYWHSNDLIYIVFRDDEDVPTWFDDEQEMHQTVPNATVAWTKDALYLPDGNGDCYSSPCHSHVSFKFIINNYNHKDDLGIYLEINISTVIRKCTQTPTRSTPRDSLRRSARIATRPPTCRLEKGHECAWE